MESLRTKVPKDKTAIRGLIKTVEENAEDDPGTYDSVSKSIGILYYEYNDLYSEFLQHYEQRGVSEMEFIRKADESLIIVCEELKKAYECSLAPADVMTTKLEKLLERNSKRTASYEPQNDEHYTLYVNALTKRTANAFKVLKTDIASHLFHVVHDMSRLESVITYEENDNVQQNIVTKRKRRFDMSI